MKKIVFSVALLCFWVCAVRVYAQECPDPFLVSSRGELAGSLVKIYDANNRYVGFVTRYYTESEFPGECFVRGQTQSGNTFTFLMHSEMFGESDDWPIFPYLDFIVSFPIRFETVISQDIKDYVDIHIEAAIRVAIANLELPEEPPEPEPGDDLVITAGVPNTLTDVIDKDQFLYNADIAGEYSQTIGNLTWSHAGHSTQTRGNVVLRTDINTGLLDIPDREPDRAIITTANGLSFRAESLVGQRMFSQGALRVKAYEANFRDDGLDNSTVTIVWLRAS